LANNVTIDANGDRYCDFSMFDLDTEKDEFVEVAVYSSKSRQLTLVDTFHWAGENGPPLDYPVCAWDMSLCGERFLFTILF
jgi:hypothetical protein